MLHLPEARSNAVKAHANEQKEKWEDQLKTTFKVAIIIRSAVELQPPLQFSGNLHGYQPPQKLQIFVTWIMQGPRGLPPWKQEENERRVSNCVQTIIYS